MPADFALYSTKRWSCRKAQRCNLPRMRLPALNPVSDMRQVLHHDLGNSGLERLPHDGLARLVVHMGDVPPLLAGDLPKLLFCASAAVGLETATQGEMAVATIAQTTAAEYPSQTMCREIVFADIHAHYRAGCDRLLVVGFDDEIEIPVAFAKDQFRLLRPAEGEDAPLVFPKTHRNDDASAQGIKRDGILLERVGALVEVDVARWKLIAGTGVSFGIRPVTLSALYALQTEKMALQHIWLPSGVEERRSE